MKDWWDWVVRVVVVVEVEEEELMHRARTAANGYFDSFSGPHSRRRFHGT